MRSLSHPNIVRYLGTAADVRARLRFPSRYPHAICVHRYLVALPQGGTLYAICLFLTPMPPRRHSPFTPPQVSTLYIFTEWVPGGSVQARDTTAAVSFHFVGLRVHPQQLCPSKRRHRS
jgi:hypothetical protein